MGISKASIDTRRRQYIYSRELPCACGCGGRDSQHTKGFRRTISNVNLLDTLEKRQDREGNTCKVIAYATVRLNGNLEQIGLLATILNGRLITYGWTRLK